MSYQASTQSNPIRVLLLGTGQMGSGIARLISEKKGLKLVGAFGRRRERIGVDLGRVIDLDRDLQISVSSDLARTITRVRPHIAIQATCSRLADAFVEIASLVERGVNVISIAEEMAYPACASPARADELHKLAVAHGVAILGTGVNPGFVLDLLVIALTGVCARIDSITAIRVNDLSPYGPTVLRSQGVGLTPKQFHSGLQEGTVVGHIGFQESIHMIAGALGWGITRIVETREPIIARIARQTPFVNVVPGDVAGCLHRAVAYRGDKAVITLIHPQHVQPEREGIDTGDTIELHGEPNMRLAGSPEIPGGIATIALAVNMIPHVLNASPGLHTMADLPVPAAMLGDARNLLRRRKQETMAELVSAGTWVEIHSIVLAPHQRAQQIPEDTKGVPLEMRVKGFLVAAASLGDQVEIVTVTGRRLNGALVEVNPSYAHGFGPPIPELLAIGGEVRALLRATGQGK